MYVSVQTSLSCMALSLLGCIWPCIQVCLGLLHTTPQTKAGSPWVLSSWGIMILASATNPLSPMIPSWAHYISVNANGTENAATNKWGSERGSETPNPQAIHSCLPISVAMHPSCSTLMGLWCNFCSLRLLVHYIIHNCLSTAGMPPPVRNQITDGPLTTLFHSAPSLLHLQSPSPTHLHLISDLSLTYLWPVVIIAKQPN